MKIIEINENTGKSLALIFDAALKMLGNEIRGHINFIESFIKDVQIVEKVVEDIIKKVEGEAHDSPPES